MNRPVHRAAFLLSAAVSMPAFAQDNDPAVETEADTVIVTGSRFGGRTSTQSPTPVDAIGRDQLQQSGRVDFIQQLKVKVPSFNTPRSLGSGVGDYLVPPSLRGLGPGEVLVFGQWQTSSYLKRLEC